MGSIHKAALWPLATLAKLKSYLSVLKSAEGGKESTRNYCLFPPEPTEAVSVQLTFFFFLIQKSLNHGL